MLDETTMKILETMKRTGDKIDPELLRDADPDQLNHLNSISMEAPDAQQVDDPSKLELFGEGLIDSYPELGRGAVQLGTHLADTLLPDSYSPSPETIREADRKAGYFRNPNENPYFKAGEQPDKKLFQLTHPFSDRELFSGFNPYETGKVAGQMGIPLGKFMPKGGLGTLKNRLKFGTGLGAGYGALLPNEGGEDYWKDKGWQMGVGAVGGPIIGEIAFRILQAGVAGAEGIQRLGNKTIDFVKSFAERIRQGEQLPESLAQLPDDALRGVPVQIQERLQQILDEAKTQGGVLTPEQALRVATQESIGYPSGTQGAEMFPHRPLTPAQLTQDPAIAAEELMLEGNPAYKQILRDQDKYMTGGAEKVQEMIEGVPESKMTGSASAPEPRLTGENIARTTEAMRARVAGKARKLYTEATQQYGKAKVKPSRFLTLAKKYSDGAVSSELKSTINGYVGQVKQAMARSAKPYKGQKGTMKADMWSSSAGKPPPPTVQPKADSLTASNLEGIRRSITRQAEQAKKGGKGEEAGLLKELRNAIDADVKASVGHDVYGASRQAHHVGMESINIPVVKNILKGGYNSDYAKVVKDVEKMSYEQLLRLKRAMYKEGDIGKISWQKLASQVWYTMKEKAIKGREGHGQGRNVSIPQIETALTRFGNSVSALGANSEKGKLLFGEDVANAINNLLKTSRDMEIMGRRETRTGWGGLVNLLDWGSKLLGKVPSLQTRGASGVLTQATQAVKQKEKDKIAEQVLERTMKNPRQFRPRPQGKVRRWYKPNPLFYPEATGIQEIDKRRKRGVLSP